MKKISVILLILSAATGLMGQSPHGDNIKLDCSLCHSVNSWNVSPDSIEFNHSDTDFELTGQHSSVNCKSCHTTLVFDQVAIECSSCHTDMHEQSVGLDCARCHSTTSWLVNDITGIHRISRFPLLGKHETASCEQCHQSGSSLRFDPLSVQCYSCHASDYNNAANPDHNASGFSTECEDCHEVNQFGWTFTAFAHDFFPLIDGHHILNCYQCHSTTTYKGLSTDCFSCHQSDYESTANPSHSDLGFSTDCSSCHTLSQNWQPADFREHDNVSFPIYSGEHRGEWNSCSTCHIDQSSYSNFSCTTCHEHNQSSMNGEHSGINGYSYQSSACYSCHPRGNEDGAFNHSATNFPLIGAHTEPSCSDCHKTNVTPSIECVGCHESAYSNTKEPDHAAIGIEITCGECHDSYAWTPSSFQHATTGFELTGGHGSIECTDCHTPDNSNITSECYDCHGDSYNTAPGHLAQNYPQDCTLCHNSTVWTQTNFNHAATDFPLLGVHTTTDCASCHESGFTGTTQICSDCHRPAYDQTTNPNHSTIGIDIACEDCHNSSSWSPSLFTHASTGFELLGSHITVLCQDCHTSSATLSQACYKCHTTEYTNAPEHLSQNYPKDCTMCHNSNLWTETSFDHAVTSFPLLGVHATTDCASCHESGFTGTSQICSDCHKAAYDQTTNPNHSEIGIGLSCEDCHDSNAWTPSLFNHVATGFILEGQHNIIECSSCHTSNANNPPSDCYSCHTNNYNNAPEHIAQSYPTDCTLCHNSTDWKQTSFDHSTTQFPLTGAHVMTVCADCHVSGYAGTSTDCNSCHNSDYTGTTDPSHSSLGLATTCQDCHTTNPGWTPATFPVHDNYYVLQGAHASIRNNCSDCHTSGYSSTPSTCYGCHEADYNSTNDPSHSASSFSTDCTDCHSQSAWEPSTFDHDNQYFPIYSGEHRGEWDACSDCHEVQSNFSIFTCISCHEHNQSEMNDEHRGINGYSYVSSACYNCHPNGSEDGAFSHSTTGFPLTGAHLASTCADCHVTQAPLSTECISCHNTEYSNAQSPNHSAIGLENTCTECHQTDAWQPSTFEHSTTGFQLAGKHSETNCAECHTTNNIASLSDQCNTCHQDAYNNAANHTAQDYPTDCTMCHNSTDWEQTDFNHSTTEFPLLGAHTSASCNSCHETSFTGTSRVCSECHKTDYDQSSNPNHSAIGLSLNCEDCHDSDAWAPSLFNHESTGFLLEGQHLSAQCSSCHTSNSESPSSDCYTCHSDKYNKAADHLTQSFPQDCSMCHNSTDWKQTDFDHSTTEFPLLGSHISASCNSCHETSFTRTSKVCSECHKTDYDQSSNPNHNVIGLSLNCEDCHDSDAWAPSLFNHESKGFMLEGQHLSAPCSDCHTSNTASPASDCYTCHMDKYNTAPEHLAQSYPQDCSMCHNSADWKQTDFDHSTTQFALTGAHSSEACTGCHESGYAGTSTDCNNCHNEDYKNTSNPNHVSLSIAVSCQDCHTTDPGWSPALFPNHTDYYLLQGAHANIQSNCGDCHTSGYNSTPTTCFGCHETDYNNTTNPNHSAASFPNICSDCHSESAWTPSTFDHDNQYFPIYTGEHRGEWNSCSDCHEVQSNFSQFTCISCHEHNKTETDSHHSGVSGYSYTSSACYDCHPTGKEDDDLTIVGAHDNTSFKLFGTHNELDCMECHTDLSRPPAIKCVSCHEHSAGRNRELHKNVRGFINKNIACVDCHQTGKAIKIMENEQ